MLAPKCATYHGRSTFANPKYCKKAQSNKPCLYEIPYDTSDPANRFAPDGEDTVTLEKESRSKMIQDQNEKQPGFGKEKCFKCIRKVREHIMKLTKIMKAQMQYKNMVKNELKKRNSFCVNQKESPVETQFDKHSCCSTTKCLNGFQTHTLLRKTDSCLSNSPEMRSFQTKQSVNKTNVSDGFFKLVTQQSLPQNRNQAVRNTNVLKPGMFRIASTTTQNRTPQLPRASRNTNPHNHKSSGVIHTTSVSRPQLKSYQVKDKVVPNISQVKFTKKEVEDNHRISSISKKTKSVTACNDSLNSRTSNVNAVCGKCVFNSDHDACVSRYLKDVNARTKKPKVVPISASKPKRKANKSVATPHKKTVASDTTIQKSKSYYKELYENTNQEWKWWIAKRCPTGYTWTQKPLRTKQIWMPKIRKANESTSISPTIDIVSRITNIVTTHPIPLLSLDAPKAHDGNLSFCVNFGMFTIKRVLLRRRPQSQSFLRCPIIDADLEVLSGNLHVFERSSSGKRFTRLDETPEVLKDFLTMIQRNLQTQVITVRTDRGTEFLNKTLHAYFKEEGIEHQTSTPRSPEQNDVVERRNLEGISCYNTRPLNSWSPFIQVDEIKENDVPITTVRPRTLNDKNVCLKISSSGLVPQGQKGSDYDNSGTVTPKTKVLFPSQRRLIRSSKGLEFLFSPLLEEYYNPTHGLAEENNNDQAPNASSQEDEFINPFLYTSTRNWHDQLKAPQEVKRIFKYLKGTINMGLWYQRESGFKLNNNPSFQTLIMRSRMPDNSKQLLLEQRHEVAFICKFVLNNVDADSTSDYGFNYTKYRLYALSVSHSNIMQPRTTFTDKAHAILYHFIKEQVENGIIELYFVRTEYQLADMFTKALPEDRFKYLVRRIGMRCLTPAELEVLTNETA
ncbi:retrovirus-related pol polyprotein from transposon TNT 1-94 [Tanacetum coccineum]|uniref:Retrovirus-related pol polyprotein from transposon TNT 1-94 n=1 Tax=Tanacetum coccineum TaxID=301880 RepID=A0ABQ5EJM1_9ASTR